jgi:S1 RNA binding domain protein
LKDLRRSNFFMSIEVGSKLQGKVTGITNFGAFVELPGGSTGLVHISEVADNYVKDIHDHLKVGDQVEVKVINVEKDGKIGLSIKRAKDRPRRNDHRSKESFEQKMSRFLKESEDRLASLRRHTESRRGGRGARRG